MRRLALLLILAVLAALLGTAAAAEDPIASPIPVLIGEDDPGLDRIWRGISKGLEQANLDRARPEFLPADPAAVLDRIEAESPPLVFVVGRLAAQRVADTLRTVPRVYVDTAWNVNGDELPPAPSPEGRACVVRQVTYALEIAKVMKRLWPDRSKRPRGLQSWEAADETLAAYARELGPAAGYERATREADADVLVHVRLAAGEQLPSIEALVRRATEHQIPIISDDVTHWGRGAAVLLVPNHFLLGRIAAEQGRLLLAEEASSESDASPVPKRVQAGMLETWVDLGAAESQGLRPPLPWLAGVDRLRDAPRRAAPGATR